MILLAAASVATAAPAPVVHSPAQDACPITAADRETDTTILLTQRAIRIVDLSRQGTRDAERALAEIVHPSASFTAWESDDHIILSDRGYSALKSMVGKIGATGFRYTDQIGIIRNSTNPCNALKVSFELFTDKPDETWNLVCDFWMGRLISVIASRQSVVTGSVGAADD